jgi:hypothetical protein
MEMHMHKNTVEKHVYSTGVIVQIDSSGNISEWYSGSARFEYRQEQ